ncbi:snurportin-1-like isoform X2 [Argiope bruennichi]|uniref:snurportin-1-like isoform X2 n=1 Tax=Argiope bruennichi TaxID=94029 RepID=UPI002495A59F|nr:snurportin-1-like isoform X2 [Argiope bruennichi]
MEDLINALAGSQVTSQPNSTAAEHPRFVMYKAKSNTLDQETRRRKFLEAQKRKRFDYASHARQLALSKWDNGESEEENEDMDFEECIPKPPKSYRNQLMLSEWLVEVPGDLADQWYLKLCPVGKRCLIVASKGMTKAYTKSGYNIMSFPSNLPGGNKVISSKPLHVYCFLDCIYNEVEKTYYILDIMCWNSHPCFDSEFKFVPLPHYDCSKETLKRVLWSDLPFPSKLDGLLFYHKQSHYICGTTPLVGWLKAYMVPEMLSIEVPPALMAEKPSSYVSMQQHVPYAFEKHLKRKEEEEKIMYYEDD